MMKPSQNHEFSARVTGRAARIATLILLTATTSACVNEPFGAATLATTSFIMEDKLPTDYIAEAVTGKDCSYIRRLEDDGPFCRSQDYGQVIEQPIYCYKSLGNVSCYRSPNPYGDGVLPVQ